MYLSNNRTVWLNLLLIWGLLPLAPALAAPGQKHHLSAKDLPAPNSTAPGDIDARFTSTPAGAKPQVPDGFSMTPFAQKLRHPRGLTVAPNGDVFVTLQGPGLITRLRDQTGDGIAESVVEFSKGFHNPYGIIIRDGFLYVADTQAVWRAPYQNHDRVEKSAFTRITSAPNLRPDGWHGARQISVDSKGRLYLAIGSRDDVSEFPSPDATVQRIAPDGSMSLFASGLRNAQGMAFYPGTDNLWVTVNERDKLGARLPPDFLAHARQGDFFGWPYAYIGKHPDPVFGHKRPDLVAKSKMPDLLFDAHSAPLGIVFYTGKQFPAAYQNNAFVALHGSGPYDKPNGYKVVHIPFKSGKPVGGYEDFITGFSNAGLAELSVWGTPSNLAIAKDGSLLLTDDKAGIVWRVSYTGK